MKNPQPIRAMIVDDDVLILEAIRDFLSHLGYTIVGEAGDGAYRTKPPDAGAIDRTITIAMARFKDMMELRRLNAELESRNRELQAALAKVKQLSGLLPI